MPLVQSAYKSIRTKNQKIDQLLRWKNKVELQLKALEDNRIGLDALKLRLFTRGLLFDKKEDHKVDLKGSPVYREIYKVVTLLAPLEKGLCYFHSQQFHHL